MALNGQAKAIRVQCAIAKETWDTLEDINALAVLQRRMRNDTMTKIRVSITIDRNVWLAMKQRYENVSGTIERLVVEDMGLRSEYVVSEK